MGINKTKITIIDISDSHHKKYDDKVKDAYDNFVCDDKVKDGPSGDGDNNNKENSKIIVFILLIIIVVLFMFIRKMFYNGDINKIKQHIEYMNEINNQEPKLYSDLYKNLLDGTIKEGERPIRLLDKDIDLWVGKYGSTTYLISYNELTTSNIDFISDDSRNQFRTLLDLQLYSDYLYNFTKTKDCVDIVLKKLNDKNYFNNNVTINDLDDFSKIYIVNKNRIVSVREVANEMNNKTWLEVELPYGTIIKTKIEYRDVLRDKIDNNEQFANDLVNLKTILSENKNDTLNGVIIYDDTEHNMVYLYKNHVGIIQSLSSVFTKQQKEDFFEEIGKVVGELINIDYKIVINPKLIKSVKYDGLYVSINLDGGYNSLIEKIKISNEAKNKLDEFIKENDIEILDSSKDKEITFKNSKVVTKYNKTGKEYITEDERAFYSSSLNQLKEILSKHNNDILNAVIIDRDNNHDVIVYYFKNSAIEVKPILLSFSTSQKQEFFYLIEKTMGDILILDDKVLLNPKLIRNVIYDNPYTTIYLDGGLNSVLWKLNLSQQVINELKEWQVKNNIQ